MSGITLTYLAVQVVSLVAQPPENRIKLVADLEITGATFTPIENEGTPPPEPGSGDYDGGTWIPVTLEPGPFTGAVPAVTGVGRLSGQITLPAMASLTCASEIDAAPERLAFDYLASDPGEHQVTLTAGGVELGTFVTDLDGDILGGSVLIPEVAPFVTPGPFALEATSPTGGPASADFVVLAPPEIPPATAPDATPQPVPQPPHDVKHWILQDVTPGGLGSWVLPHNPVSHDPLPVDRAVDSRRATSPTGQFHLHDGWLNVRSWSFAGFCPNKAFYDRLVAYGKLNRRLYLFDHRDRVWTIAIEEVEVVPRKRIREDDGAWNDWAGEYTVRAVIFADRGWSPAP